MNYLTIILAVLLLASCQEEKPIEEHAATTVVPAEEINDQLVLSDDQLKTFSIEHSPLQEKEISGVLNLNGKVDVDPDYVVSLSSQLGGHVKSVNALPGKVVRHGEPIVTLEDHQFIQLQLDYLTTKAQLLSAEPNYLRQKELNSTKSTSDKILQEAETEYQSLLATKSALEEKLRLIDINPATLTSTSIHRSITIAAPFNGVVSAVLVNKGKYVSPSDVLVELINPQGLLLNIKVFEKDWSKISVGQLLDASSYDRPTDKLKARVISKGNSIRTDGATEVFAKVIEGNTSNLINGLYINAEVALDRVASFVLPTESIVSFGGKNYIFEWVNKNEFHLLAVTIGKVLEDTTEIVNHQDVQGKEIVSKGAYTLLMALKNEAEE